MAGKAKFDQEAAFKSIVGADRQPAPEPETGATPVAAEKNKGRVQRSYYLVVGLAYFILLAAVSFAVEKRWDMSFQHLVTTFCMCLGGGALGGMLA